MQTHTLLRYISLLQAVLALRVFGRMMRRSTGARIVPEEANAAGEERVSIIVPVLNEYQRLTPCLEGLIAQGIEVAEIVVVDGGSVDGTQELVREYTQRDSRVRLVDASPIPSSWNGKAWGLQVGLDALETDARWILTIDADVRPHVPLVRALLGRAQRLRLAAVSVAVRQKIDGVGQGLLHPALLTTLVYRFGRPGQIFRHVNDVQANGQCFLLQRDVLHTIDGFSFTRQSRCEDVTLARLLVKEGYRVGFYEVDSFVDVNMYTDWRDLWSNWPRSLPMHDQFSGFTTVIGWLEIACVQALPLPLLAFLLVRRKQPLWSVILNSLLCLVRVGVLFGTARAYSSRPCSYWLSPLTDCAVALWLGKMTIQRRHRWRGRVMVRNEKAI